LEGKGDIISICKASFPPWEKGRKKKKAPDKMMS